MKACSKCHQQKPESDFSRNLANGKSRSQCKECCNAAARSRNAKNREMCTVDSWSDFGGAVCRECGVEKPLSEFSIDRRWAGRRRSKCKECGAKKLREWRIKNSERYAENYRARSRLMPAYYNHFTAKRRARQLTATPGWANEFFISEAYQLARLRERTCGGRWEVDHIVPLQSRLVCGLHVEHNLRVIPRRENRTKRNLVWPDMP
jgi:hypothetical protein